jgi:hypothetical protein
LGSVALAGVDEVGGGTWTLLSWSSWALATLAVRIANRPAKQNPRPSEPIPGICLEGTDRLEKKVRWRGSLIMGEIPD